MCDTELRAPLLRRLRARIDIDDGPLAARKRNAAVFACDEEAVRAGVVREIADPKLDPQHLRGNERIELLDIPVAADRRTPIERDDGVIDMLGEIGRRAER